MLLLVLCFVKLLCSFYKALAYHITGNTLEKVPGFHSSAFILFFVVKPVVFVTRLHQSSYYFCLCTDGKPRIYHRMYFNQTNPKHVPVAGDDQTLKNVFVTDGPNANLSYISVIKQVS